MSLSQKVLVIPIIDVIYQHLKIIPVKMDNESSEQLKCLLLTASLSPYNP